MTNHAPPPSRDESKSAGLSHWRPPRRERSNMHDNVPMWCDTCCCEPENRWRALGEQMGIDVDGPGADAE